MGRIAAALYLDESTVAEHRGLYLERGRAGVESLTYTGRISRLSADERKALSDWIAAEVPQTAQTVCDWVKVRFDVTYASHAMARLLGQIGFVFKKPKCVPAKADAAIQQAFLNLTLAPLMQTAGPETPLYFVDGCHPSYTGRPAHGWIRRGATVELKSNHGRTRIDINGAPSWPERTLVHREEERITSAAMIRLFTDLEARHPQAPEIARVLDNARYNRSRELRAWLDRPGSRIRLVYLPSYAPNLNLIERFWHFMKRKVLFNRAYAKFALFKQAFDDFFQSLNDHQPALESLITDRVHLIGRADDGIPAASRYMIRRIPHETFTHSQGRGPNADAQRSTMTWKVGAVCALAVLAFGFADTFAKVSAPANAVSAAPARVVWRAAFAAPAAIPFPEDNPYNPAKAELGRRLFFDPILSGDRSRACVSCHLPDRGWSDGRTRARSRHESDLDLHTPTLLNLAWQEGRLGWDGKFRDLESVAFMPITAPGNMNLTVAEALRRIGAEASYVEAFARAFADGAVTQGRVEAALATFQRLIVSGPSPFDRWIAGDEAAIPEPAKRGFDLFNGRANCAACHGGWSFSDGSFHDIGTGRDEDIGRGRLVPGSTALRYAFKTPGLRDVARRAPYMHDGSLPSLEAVVDLYDRGGIARPSRSRDIRPLGLTAAERADLIAFLGTLTSDEADGTALAEFGAAPPTP